MTLRDPREPPPLWLPIQRPHITFALPAARPRPRPHGPSEPSRGAPRQRLRQCPRRQPRCPCLLCGPRNAARRLNRPVAKPLPQARWAMELPMQWRVSPGTSPSLQRQRGPTASPPRHPPPRLRPFIRIPFSSLSTLRFPGPASSHLILSRVPGQRHVLPWLWARVRIRPNLARPSMLPTTLQPCSWWPRPRRYRRHSTPPLAHCRRNRGIRQQRLLALSPFRTSAKLATPGPQA